MIDLQTYPRLHLDPLIIQTPLASQKLVQFETKLIASIGLITTLDGKIDKQTDRKSTAVDSKRVEDVQGGDF